MKLASPTCLLGCALMACSDGVPLQMPPGLQLELAFEQAFAPTAAAALQFEVPRNKVRFEQGVEGLAASFDGSGAALQIGGLAQLGLSQAFTLEFFFNPADWKNPYAAGAGLESMVSYSDSLSVAFNPHDLRLEARVTVGAVETSLALRGGKVETGLWHHAALSYDGTSAQLYLDGQVIAREPASGLVQLDPNLKLVIGTWYEKNQAYRGMLDSIRLWSRPLTAQELRQRVALRAGGGRVALR